MDEIQELSNIWPRNGRRLAGRYASLRNLSGRRFAGAVKSGDLSKASLKKLTASWTRRFHGRRGAR